MLKSAAGWTWTDTEVRLERPVVSDGEASWSGSGAAEASDMGGGGELVRYGKGQGGGPSTRALCERRGAFGAQVKIFEGGRNGRGGGTGHVNGWLP